MFDDILLFVKVVNYGKVALAAHELNLSYTTIMRKIEQLEEFLNLSLIKRNSRILELTPSGKLLYDKFKVCENEIIAKCQPVSLTPQVAKQRLTIVLPLAFLNWRLSWRIQQLFSQFNNIELCFRHYIAEIDLAQISYDLAIVTYANISSERGGKLFYLSKLLLVCSPAYLQNHGEVADFEHLAKHNFIGRLIPTTRNNRTVILYGENDQQEHELSIDFKLRMNNFAEAKELVKSGVAIAGLPEYFIQQELASGEFCRVLPDYHLGYLPYYLFSHLEESDPYYQAFYQLLQDYLGPHQFQRNVGLV